MRVTNDVSLELLASLGQLREQEQNALTQLTTGRRLNVPSDDPAAVAELIGNRSDSSQADQILQNVASLRGTLQVADSTLNSAVLALTRASTLGVEGANGTLSADNRQALAEEINGLRDQLLALANVTYQGTYIFSGTAVTTAPYVLDASSSSGVAYKGNDGVVSIDVGGGQTMPMNVAGNRLFSGPGANAFQALTDLSQALVSGTGIDTATNEVHAALAYVNTQRAFYGTTLSRLDTAESFLNAQKLQLSQQENSLDGVDMNAAASQLVQSTNALNAAMNAAARMTQLSLLDFLK